MAKRISIGAQRRTAAKLKAQESSKTKFSSASARRVSKRPTVKDPELTNEPINFDPSTFKFVLTPPAPPAAHQPPAYENLGELPEAYGTKKLFLTARDPHWVYAYWDLTDAQFLQASQDAHDHKVFLELFPAGSQDRLQQIQIPRGAKGWYLLVGAPDSYFYARLGYYTQDGQFAEISRSGVAHTPRDTLSWKTQTRFVTIPFHINFQELFAVIKPHLLEGEELAEGLSRLQENGFQFPFAIAKLPEEKKSRNGTHAESREHVVENLNQDMVRQIRVGSMEITEIIRRRLEQMHSSSSGQWISSWGGSSPMGSSFGSSFGVAKNREFYMHVNAELIIYGGTDPQAKVQINGQKIKLREDGTFSYHFTLPDGRFFIPIEATSPDNVETRSAMLSFLRMSDYVGDVKATGQEPRPEPIGRVA